ncbi:hypothetical protein D9M72_614980 [compost metagenome]
MFGIDADPGILHAQVRPLVIAPPANADIAFGRGVFHRVEHQVGKRAAQLRFAALEQNRRIGFQGDFLVFLTGQLLRIALDR